MQDKEFEAKGDALLNDQTEQLKQLDDVINEPVKSPNTIVTLAGEVTHLVLETFSVYKTKEVLKMLAKAKGDIDILSLIADIQKIATPIPSVKTNPDGTKGEWTEEEKNQLAILQAQRVQAAMETLPTLIDVVPDLLLDFGALAIIPNRELQAAYDSTGAAIAELREEKRKWLEFNFDASAPFTLLISYLPYIGINLITQELGKLDRAVPSLLPTTK